MTRKNVKRLFVLSMLVFFSQSFILSQNYQEKSILKDVNVTTNLHFADINDDGRNDLIGGSDTLLFWMENNGDGSYSNYQVVCDTLKGVLSVTSSDVNQNGVEDIISISSISEGDHVIYIHENSGNGVFNDMVMVDTVFNRPYQFFMTPMDQDTLKDLMVLTDDVSYYYKNINQDYFADTFDVIASHESFGAYPVDIDKDNDVDVIVRDQISGDVAAILNNGDGSFASPVIVGNVSLPYSIYAADLNGDTLPEILLSLYSKDEGVYLKNNGDGSFAEDSVLVSGHNSIRDLKAADLDNDGDNDIFWASFSFNAYVGYKENLDGQGDFSGEAVELKTGMGGASAVYGDDLNMDSAFEVIADLGSGLVWFEEEPLSTSQLHSKHDVIVKSNPADQFITVQSKDDGISGISLYNVKGMQLFKKTHIDAKDFKMKVSEYPAGIYFLRVKKYGSFETYKILIE